VRNWWEMLNGRLRLLPTKKFYWLLEKFVAENISPWETEIEQISLSDHGSVGLYFLATILGASFAEPKTTIWHYLLYSGSCMLPR